MRHVLKRNLMRARGSWVAAPLIAGALSACSPLNVLDTLVPAGEYDRLQGIAYGELPRQKLDIYRPANSAQSGPVVIFFYGGSWKTGARDKYRFVGEALTRKGLTVVIPDYRLYPDVTFPAFMHDAAKAVRWTFDNLAGSNRGRPDQGQADETRRAVFLAGHSAGAHIAALMTVDSQYFDQADVASSQICGVIGISGPYAFDPSEYRSTRPVFAGLTNSDVARPVKRITGPTPPFLLLHGDADGTVRPSNTAEFAAALRSAGTRVRTEFLPDIGHYRIILAMATPFDDTAPVNERIFDFIADRKDCR